MMESRYWDMLMDANDLYHKAPTGPKSPTQPKGSWEGHQHQYEGWRNNLNRNLQEFHEKKCKDQIPPNHGLWAMQPAPDQPYFVANPGTFGPPSMPKEITPPPSPVPPSPGAARPATGSWEDIFDIVDVYAQAILIRNGGGCLATSGRNLLKRGMPTTSPPPMPVPVTP